ncbi:hypothetical protein UNDKW_4088 [Undibacterium sp. KW1]|nr:hypothetical protein UNDKW_4088 [Undibacterium sp. KW1]
MDIGELGVLQCPQLYGDVAIRTNTNSRALSDLNAARITMFKRMDMNAMDSCLRRNDDREDFQASRCHGLPGLM